MNVVNVVIAAVGGQGGLTLARVLATAATLEGLNVRTGETLGMAQRYGSVVSYVRIGTEVYSPIFSPCEADYLLGLELSETLRNVQYLKPEGVVIAADEYRPSYSMSISEPNTLRSHLVARVKSSVPRALIVPAKKIALEVGNPRAFNMVVLGVFAGVSKLLREASIESAIAEILPRRAVEPSVLAFKRGLELAQQAR